MYDVSVRTVRVGVRNLHVTYVQPVTPRHPHYLIVFTTGDGGWHGVNNDVIEHLASQSYSIAGLSAPDVLRPLKRARRKMTAKQAADLLGASFAQFRKDLAIEASARLIVVGFSRGATFVAFTAVHPDLQRELAGAIAIGLTRRADYLGSITPSTIESDIRLDKRRRVLIYPALKLFAHVKVAVIQSTGDRYVSAAESRALLGPDTPTRRLYAIEARNHRFGGNREQLIEDLDAALRWIERP
ncbi:MAG TPA: AcvB/VirJ family lysyl-phosphatidylglycerol hydrolase [Gammaproteobacteria bacterium]|nr:AcvB/VirJ family lysyl-phosphatidylglycerol hydrolase [Gammaproteobacteria bacterium]